MKNKLEKYGQVLENVSLKDYNTYKIGGLAQYLVSPFDEANLIALMKFIKENNLKYFLLGNGSNLVFSENFFAGVIIKLNNLNTIKIMGDKVKVAAGVMLPKLVMKCINHDLFGLEWATGIPGTIGGSVVGNAGAYKACLFDFIEEVEILTADSQKKNLKKNEIEYGYRYSIFKDQRNIIILNVVLKLTKGNKEESLEIIERRRKKRIETQPLEYPSAGSVFRNPEVDFAGHIIEILGLKGKTVGGAEVSEKHANFVINKNNASANDVKDLIQLVHEKVLEKTGIDLVVEQEFVNWE